MCLVQGCELSHVRDEHAAKTADETWLPHFAANGGVAFLSADGRILKRPHQLIAVRDAGLVCVILSEQWAVSRRHEQAANVIFWWPSIEAAIGNSKPGDCWLVPFAFGKDDKLIFKPIDYDKAAKAVSK